MYQSGVGNNYVFIPHSLLSIRTREDRGKFLYPFILEACWISGQVNVGDDEWWAGSSYTLRDRGKYRSICWLLNSNTRASTEKNETSPLVAKTRWNDLMFSVKRPGANLGQAIRTLDCPCFLYYSVIPVISLGPRTSPDSLGMCWMVSLLVSHNGSGRQ